MPIDHWKSPAPSIPSQSPGIFTLAKFTMISWEGKHSFFT